MACNMSVRVQIYTYSGFPFVFLVFGQFFLWCFDFTFLFFYHKHVFVFNYISYSLKHTCFWLCRAPIAVHGLSLAAANGLLPSCTARSSRCSGLSLQSVGSGCSFSVAASTWAQQSPLVGSRARAQQLGCSVACGSVWTFGPGIKPVSPALTGGLPSTTPPGKSHRRHL